MCMDTHTQPEVLGHICKEWKHKYKKTEITSSWRAKKKTYFPNPLLIH
jgi:hypothetical protein